MGKFKIFLVFSLLGTILTAHEYQNNMGEIHSRIILNRGEEQFRTNVLANQLKLSGQSNSNQYIEYLGKGYGNNRNESKYTRSKSFLLGTNSNLVKHPNMFAGISLGHLKSTLKLDDRHTAIRSYGFNYLVGYKKDNLTFIGKAGYTQSKNSMSGDKYKSKVYLAGAEIGYSHFFNTTTVAYPFVGLNFNRYTIKKHSNIKSYNENILSNAIGVNLLKILNDKFMVTGGVDWNFEFNSRKYPLEHSKEKDLHRHFGQLHMQVGYFIDPDFLFTVGYRNLFNRDYKYHIFSMGLSHYF